MEWVGYLAGALTTISFFPQAYQIYKTKNTQGISIWMYVLFCIGLVLWLIYGYILKSYPILIFNLITLVLGLYILAAKLKWRS